MKFTSLIRYVVPVLVAANLYAGSAGPTFDVKSGTAAIVLDPTFVAGAFALQARIAKIAPASYSPLKRTVTVSVVGGGIQLSDAQSEIIGSGGFKVTKGAFTFSLADFVMVIPPNPAESTVSALLTANGVFQGRVVLSTFDAGALDLTVPVVVPANKKLAIKSIPLKLTADSAQFLNDTLDLPPGTFSDGDTVGEINIKFKVAGRF